MKRGIREPRHLHSLLLLGVGAFLAFPSSAEAYIDPGTGSIVLQMLIAGALGAIFTVKRFWSKIVSFLRSVGKRS